jgi:hypothetical protein
MAVTAETNGTNGHSNGVPEKKREVSNHHMDSTIWNELEMRPDDIVIATYAKSGTTVCCSHSQDDGQLTSPVDTADCRPARPPSRPDDRRRLHVAVG